LLKQNFRDYFFAASGTLVRAHIHENTAGWSTPVGGWHSNTNEYRPERGSKTYAILPPHRHTDTQKERDSKHRSTPSVVGDEVPPSSQYRVKREKIFSLCQVKLPSND